MSLISIADDYNCVGGSSSEEGEREDDDMEDNISTETINTSTGSLSSPPSNCTLLSVAEGSNNGADNRNMEGNEVALISREVEGPSSSLTSINGAGSGVPLIVRRGMMTILDKFVIYYNENTVAQAEAMAQQIIIGAANSPPNSTNNEILTNVGMCISNGGGDTVSPNSTALMITGTPIVPSKLIPPPPEIRGNEGDESSQHKLKKKKKKSRKKWKCNKCHCRQPKKSFTVTETSPSAIAIQKAKLPFYNFEEDSQIAENVDNEDGQFQLQEDIVTVEQPGPSPPENPVPESNSVPSTATSLEAANSPLALSPPPPNSVDIVEDSNLEDTLVVEQKDDQKEKSVTSTLSKASKRKTLCKPRPRLVLCRAWAYGRKVPGSLTKKKQKKKKKGRAVTGEKNAIKQFVEGSSPPIPEDSDAVGDDFTSELDIQSDNKEQDQEHQLLSEKAEEEPAGNSAAIGVDKPSSVEETEQFSHFEEIKDNQEDPSLLVSPISVVSLVEERNINGISSIMLSEDILDSPEDVNDTGSGGTEQVETAIGEESSATTGEMPQQDNLLSPQPNEDKEEENESFKLSTDPDDLPTTSPVPPDEAEVSLLEDQPQLKLHSKKKRKRKVAWNRQYRKLERQSKEKAKQLKIQLSTPEENAIAINSPSDESPPPLSAPNTESNENTSAEEIFSEFLNKENKSSVEPEEQLGEKKAQRRRGRKRKTLNTDPDAAANQPSNGYLRILSSTRTKRIAIDPSPVAASTSPNNSVGTNQELSVSLDLPQFELTISNGDSTGLQSGEPGTGDPPDNIYDEDTSHSDVEADNSVEPTDFDILAKLAAEASSPLPAEIDKDADELPEKNKNLSQSPFTNGKKKGRSERSERSEVLERNRIRMQKVRLEKKNQKNATTVNNDVSVAAAGSSTAAVVTNSTPDTPEESNSHPTSSKIDEIILAVSQGRYSREDGTESSFSGKTNNQIMEQVAPSPEEPTLYRCPYPNCGLVYGDAQSFADHLPYHDKSLTKLKKSRQRKTQQVPCESNDPGSASTELNQAVPPPSSSGVKPTCEICKKEFTRKDNLKQHMLIHSGKYPLPCPVEICNRSFRKRIQLKKHMERFHSKEEVAKCFPLPVQNAEEKVKNCWVSLVRCDHLVAQYKAPSTVPSTPSPQSSSSSSKAKAKNAPDISGKRKASIQAREKILFSQNEHFQDTETSSEEGRVNIKAKTEVSSPLDSPPLSRTQKWNGKKTQNQTSNNFKCSFCPRQFKNKLQLTNHLVKHCDKRRFSCNLCGKAYRSKTNLNSHKARFHKNEDVNSVAVAATGNKRQKPSTKGQRQRKLTNLETEGPCLPRRSDLRRSRKVKMYPVFL